MLWPTHFQRCIELRSGDFDHTKIPSMIHPSGNLILLDVSNTEVAKLGEISKLP